MRTLAILIAALLIASPVAAQEPTPEATPAVIDAPDTVTDITVESGGSITIEAPAPVEAPSNNVYVGIGALLFGVAAIVYAIRRGGNPDQNATLELQRIQANRQAMDVFETQFQQQQETTRQLIGAFTMIIKAVAPLTPITADDELGDFLSDISTPGAPTGTPGT